MTRHWHDDEFEWCPCDEPAVLLVPDGDFLRADATIPSEGWDETHPDHDAYVRGAGRCFANCERHFGGAA